MEYNVTIKDVKPVHTPTEENPDEYSVRYEMSCSNGHDYHKDFSDINEMDSLDKQLKEKILPAELKCKKCAFIHDKNIN